MTYSIEWYPQALKFLESLPNEISRRIWNKLDEVKLDPIRYFEHYEGEYYKLRIGGYRLLIDVDFKEKVLFIRVLDKRGRVYKR